jgi:hypothetical protein
MMLGMNPTLLRTSKSFEVKGKQSLNDPPFLGWLSLQQPLSLRAIHECKDPPRCPYRSLDGRASR